MINSRISIRAFLLGLIPFLLLMSFQMSPLTINLNDTIGWSSLQYKLIGFLILLLTSFYLTIYAIKKEKINNWNKMSLALNFISLFFSIISAYSIFNLMTAYE